MIPCDAMELALTDLNIATMAGDDYGVIEDGAIVAIFRSVNASSIASHGIMH